jgi:hypothetical protein
MESVIKKHPRETIQTKFSSKGQLLLQGYSRCLFLHFTIHIRKTQLISSMPLNGSPSQHRHEYQWHSLTVHTVGKRLYSRATSLALAKATVPNLRTNARAVKNCKLSMEKNYTWNTDAPALKTRTQRARGERSTPPDPRGHPCVALRKHIRYALVWIVKLCQ